jgi:geranylgeranyl reductase family protein
VTDRWDVVVVGAGPAGATTALLLARAGASVLLLDRARFPRDKACSEYLSPATTEILVRLGGGIVDAVEGSAHAKLYGMKVVAPGGAAMCGRFRGGPRPYSFALPRTTFDSILVTAAARAGARVCEATTVDNLVWENGAVAGVVAHSRSGQRITWNTRVVVGADGLRSVVARRLRLVRSSPPRRVAFSAHVGDVTGIDGVGELHVGARGYVGLGPIGGGITTVALVVPLSAVRRSRSEGRDFRRDFFIELERFPGLAGRFDPRRLVRGVLATGPFAQWSRTATASGGGALLVGDAADFFDPFTGQGIYAALRGAELAAECLIPILTPYPPLRSGEGGRPEFPLSRRERGIGGEDQGPLSAAVLAPYVHARRREFAGKWLLERLIGVGVGWPALTDRVVGRLAARPDLADLLVSATGNIVPARRVLAASVLAQFLW